MRQLLKITAITSLTVLVLAQSNQTSECINGPSFWYRGHRNYTHTGKTCVRWDVNQRYIPGDGAHHNYCRNPTSNVFGTWCYVSTRSRTWEFCNITKCPDDTLVLFTTYNTVTRRSEIYQLPADPELHAQQYPTQKNFTIGVMYSSPRQNSEYTALATDPVGERVFIGDDRQVLRINLTEKRLCIAS
ncbi:plasminogen-like [Ciona intestinalis]